MHPFRFLATVDENPGLAELTALARKAEVVGCSVFVLPDHLPDHLSGGRLEIGWIREAAGMRFGELELNTYPAGGPLDAVHPP